MELGKIKHIKVTRPSLQVGSSVVQELWQGVKVKVSATGMAVDLTPDELLKLSFAISKGIEKC